MDYTTETGVELKAAAKALITAHEARRKFKYRDSKKKVSVAIGINMDDPGARHLFATVIPEVNFDDVYAGKVGLTDEQIDKLFDHTFQIASDDAEKLVPSFPVQPEPVQLVLLDMSFNMGYPTFSQFKGFLGAIESEHYPEAAAHLRSSLWFHEVGKRADDDLALLSQVVNYRSFTNNGGGSVS